ncbi:putative PH-like domain superfamily protein [Helianthus debilis subsp. tardiflorus]
MSRVKVYRLDDDGEWEDYGTGHVAIDYLEVYTIIAWRDFEDSNELALSFQEATGCSYICRGGFSMVPWVPRNPFDSKKMEKISVNPV